MHFELFLPHLKSVKRGGRQDLLLWHGECSSTHRSKPYSIHPHPLRLSLLHFLMAQPWGELHADGMQILLTFTDIIIFPKHVFISGKWELQYTPQSSKFTCHQQLKKRGKERKRNGKLTVSRQNITCFITHPLLVS